MPMAISRVLCLHLLLILPSILCCRSATTPADDRDALLAFKAAITGDARGVVARWNSSLDFCRWTGVVCNDSGNPGRVSSLSLESMGLEGVISPAIADLTCLDTLHLGDNSFHGSVPPEISRLSRLSYLNLSLNSLSGTIPPSISLCANLTTVDLSSNSISGSIPTQLGSLLKLLFLDLGKNKLSGEIPSSLGKLSSLETLDLSINELSREIPGSLGNLFSLSYLDLSDNNLEGSIPVSFGSLSSIRKIKIATNNLAGEIPPEMSNLSKLMHIDLTDNSLTGEIPSWMGSELPLVVLGMSHNKLHGRIPDSFGDLVNLTFLDLHTNNLTGPIPPSITSLSSLQVLDLSENQLDGSLPEEIGRLKKLYFLQLNENNLSGNLPLSLFNITSLGTVSMGYNQFTGRLPEDIGYTLPNLQFLSFCSNKLGGSIPVSLRNAVFLETLGLCLNNFSGPIPAIFGRLTNLKHVVLHTNSFVASNAADWEFVSSLANCTVLEQLSLMNNKLGGELPSSIANLSTQLQSLTLGGNQIHGTFPPIWRYVNLTTVNLHDNHFTGPIPDFLGELVNLEAFFLNNNTFSGPIPPALGNLTRLNELRLDHNFFNGSLPTTLGNLQNLIYLNISSNRITGAIPKELLSIGSLSYYLDMSSNYLTGELPEEVGQLRAIQYLSFFNNSLSGRIPLNIGGCQGLQILNLSRNFFEGPIPEALSSLKGLERLDLSMNNLSGPIPGFLENYPDMQRLDLSFNNLSGEVPENGIFKNPSEFSVAGNSKLCGGIPSLNLPSCSSHKSFPLALRLVIPIIGVILLLCLFTTCYFMRNRKRPSLIPRDEAAIAPTKVSYLDLAKATDDFSSENLIGVGSYGSVYRGFMGDGELLVAIKVLNMQQRGAFKSFVAEYETLRNIRHRNLVKVITTCASVDFRGGEFRAILFEFMPNGSLENWLHPQSNGHLHTKRLGLVQRLNIAIDVAAALEYLHDHCETPIIHRDLKPSNVLLDGSMTARVGDFGIARFLPRTKEAFQSSSLAIKGSIGYMAPEYGMSGQVSTQADVYSYGVLVLEMFTGKRPTDDLFGDNYLTLQKYVEGILLKGAPVSGMVDPSLFSEASEDASDIVVGRPVSERITRCLESVLMVGLNCAQESPRERITMADAGRRMETIKNLLHASKI